MTSYLNASEIATLLQVDRATVTRWAQQGKIKGAIKVSHSSQWRIPMSSFEELIKTIK
jgi:excisionase family DNA binding protein